LIGAAFHPRRVSGSVVPLEIRKPGDIVEGYRVMAELGRGAASTIWLVQDPKTKQIWALKHVVKNNEKEQRFLDQAEQEYRVASKLNSAAVRKIDRVIRKKEGLLGGTIELYLVMEHVDGSSAERHPPSTLEDLCWICEQVAKGLHYMHTQGFVHADMKPNNIIVDDKLTARIIDLGQSCKAGTIKERIQGTPDYIAPEQVHRRAITSKTDVYNLGATMYWMLTRHFVPTALAKSDSLVGSIDDSLIPRPKRPIEINPRVHEMLDQLVMECVEINADDRPHMELVADRLNLIRGKLQAEQILRKSGQMPKVEPMPGPGSRDGSGGGTRGLSNSGSGSKVSPVPSPKRSGGVGDDAPGRVGGIGEDGVTPLDADLS
jgi:serine/threonine protein kinase